MSLDPSNAAGALEAARDSRRRFALEQAHWPLSRHAAFGVLIAGLAAAQAAPLPFNVLADAALACTAAGVAAVDRKRRGVFINGWRSGRTLWVTLVMVGLATVLGLFGLWLSLERGLAWAPIAIGAVLLPVGTVASKVWEQVYRRELQESL